MASILTVLATFLIITAVAVLIAALLWPVFVIGEYLFGKLGLVGALVLEIMIIGSLVLKIIWDIDSDFENHLLDGPVGFGAGMFGGFVMIFTPLMFVVHGVFVFLRIKSMKLAEE